MRRASRAHRNEQNASAALIASGAALLLCVAAFAGLTLLGTKPSIAAAQLAYVVVPIGAAVVGWLAWRESAGGTREKRVWLMVTVIMASISVGESIFGAMMIADPATVALHPSPVDVAYGISAAAMVALVLTLAGIGRLPRATRTRLVADTVVVFALLCAVLYFLWVRNHVSSLQDPDVAAAAFYAGQSIVTAFAALLLYIQSRIEPAPRWVLLMGLAFITFGVSAVLWPAWNAGQIAADESFIELGTESCFVLGYGLMGLAGVDRLETGEAWEPPVLSRPIEGRLATVGVVVSGLVTFSMVVLVALALTAPDDSPDEVVYTGLAALATLGIIARSAAASFEHSRLAEESITDPIAAVGNHRWFEDRLSASMIEARRSRNPVSIAVMDLDDFARVNSRVGYSAGDELLHAVGVTLLGAVVADEQVFRLSGDEFAVLMPETGIEQAEERARTIAAAIRGLDAGPTSLTVSVGVASFPEDANSPSALFDAADGAQIWAKHHGKNRTVLARAGVSGTSSGIDPLVLAQRGVRLDLARGLAAAIDSRDQSNTYHSANVAALVSLVAEELGLDAEYGVRLEAAGLLHDVGTLALSDDTLLSHSRSASIQRREHAALGGGFCTSIGFEEVAPWVRHHHERWDGAGFPDGLAGEDIPFEARLICLCNAYDRMTAGGPQDMALSRAAALQEIDLGIGSRFDPELAERFIAIIGGHHALGWLDSEVEAS